MNPDPDLIAIAAGLVFLALGTGIWIGRRSGKLGQEVRELHAKLETASKERELAQASLEAARADAARAAQEHDEYRESVVAHFNGASDLMRDLTLQYRAVYDHLTAGATGLCPPGSVGLQEGLRVESLATGAAERAEGAEEPSGGPEAEASESPGAESDARPPTT
jgi:uncharacterized membrane-anchored protein YhcB (DUF1043 family)